VEAYKTFYSHLIPAINFNQLQHGVCKPPPFVKPRGRPKKKRIPSSWENQPKQTKQCGFCNTTGYNIKSCPQLS